MGVENDIFGSEIGSGFGVPGSIPPPKFLRSTPPRHPRQENKMGSVSRRQSRQFFQFLDSATFC